MKRRPVLKKQVVERRPKSRFSEFLRTARRISRWAFWGSLLLVGSVAISLLFVSLYNDLLRSSYIRLEHVVLTGVDDNLKAKLLEMAKLNFNTSLLAIDLNEIKRNLEQDPWVKSVDLEKHFPHTLMIRAEKEDPWAIVAMEKLYYMNEQGQIFKALDPDDETDFPVITGISTQGGQDRQKLVALAVEVLKTLDAENDPWSRKNLSEVHVTKDGDVVLYFSRLPASIKIRGSDLAGRMEDLKKLVNYLNGAGRIQMVSSIDLNYAEGAVVVFKKS
jgi:cell division protein FtsQ